MTLEIGLSVVQSSVFRRVGSYSTDHTLAGELELSVPNPKEDRSFILEYVIHMFCSKHFHYQKEINLFVFRDLI